MAKQVITKILDDMDGGEADETVNFAIDGIAYEIDLSAKNAGKLRDFLADYQEAGTRIGRVGAAPQLRSYRANTPAHTATVQQSREENQRIRTWAIDNGYDLAERGRIPQLIVDAYNTGTPNPVRTLVPNEAAAEAVKAEVEQTGRKRASKRVVSPAFTGVK